MPKFLTDKEVSALKSLEMPEHFTEYSNVMSNFDGKIDKEVADHIKGKPLYSGYPAWDFCGRVWFADRWYCEVRSYGSHVGTYSAETLELLKEAICIEHGYR